MRLKISTTNPLGYKVIQCPNIYKDEGHRNYSAGILSCVIYPPERKPAPHASGHSDDVLEPVFLDQLSELVQVADKPAERFDELVGLLAGGRHGIR